MSCEKSTIQLAGQRERMLWSPDSRLPWRMRSRSGKEICWDGHAPAQIQLNPGKIYTVQYTLNVSAAPPAEGAILLRQSPCGVLTDALPLRFSIGCQRQTLHYAAVLRPCASNRCSVELSLVLDARTSVCVEQAIMDVIEL